MATLRMRCGGSWCGGCRRTDEGHDYGRAEACRDRARPASHGGVTRANGLETVPTGLIRTQGYRRSGPGERG